MKGSSLFKVIVIKVGDIECLEQPGTFFPLVVKFRPYLYAWVNRC